MTVSHPTSASPADARAVSEAVSESLGARLARQSRDRQGLPPGITDPMIRERLRVLCGLPKPPGSSGVPYEFDPAGE